MSPTHSSFSPFMGVDMGRAGVRGRCGRRTAASNRCDRLLGKVSPTIDGKCGGTRRRVCEGVAEDGGWLVWKPVGAASAVGSRCPKEEGVISRQDVRLSPPVPRRSHANAAGSEKAPCCPFFSNSCWRRSRRPPATSPRSPICLLSMTCTTRCCGAPSSTSRLSSPSQSGRPNMPPLPFPSRSHRPNVRCGRCTTQPANAMPHDQISPR